jgi:predicted acetyltransferase
MPIDVRTARDADREAMHQLGQQSFSARPAPYDEAADRAAVPLERRLVATDDEKVVGKLAVWELGQWFGGRRVPMAGVGGVGVEPAYRGRGVATALLGAALPAMRERGEVISTLYPMNHTLYRRHGWELAGAYPEYKVDAQAFAKLPRPSGTVRLRRAEPTDLPRLRELHEAVSREEPGNLWYGDTFAERRLLGHPIGQDTHVAEHDGIVTGAIALERADTSDERAFYTLSVRQLIAADLDTELALLHLIGNHYPVARTVEIVSPHHHTLAMLLGERDAHPTGAGWCWMSRLVDAPGAVAARGFRPEIDVEVHLDIADRTAPWNAGPQVLRIKDGTGQLEPGGRADVRVDTGFLAALYTGWANPWRLARVGKLPGASDADLHGLDGAFRGPTPWARDFF